MRLTTILALVSVPGVLAYSTTPPLLLGESMLASGKVSASSCAFVVKASQDVKRNGTDYLACESGKWVASGEVSHGKPIYMLESNCNIVLQYNPSEVNADGATNTWDLCGRKDCKGASTCYMSNGRTAYYMGDDPAKGSGKLTGWTDYLVNVGIVEACPPAPNPKDTYCAACSCVPPNGQLVSSATWLDDGAPPSLCIREIAATPR